MSEAADVEKGGKEMKELEYNCTLIYFANQIGIHLWQAMEMMKYAKLIYEKDRKKIDIAWQLERSKLLEVVEILKSQLAKMRKAGSVGKIFEIITRNTIANHWYPSSDNLCADLARVIAQAIAEEVEK